MFVYLLEARLWKTGYSERDETCKIDWEQLYDNAVEFLLNTTDTDRNRATNVTCMVKMVVDETSSNITKYNTNTTTNQINKQRLCLTKLGAPVVCSVQKEVVRK